MSTQDPNHAVLKQRLAITPKTTNLLLYLGYTDYRSLAQISPNQLLAQFATVPSLEARLVEGYRRGTRRMVWLGTQDEPEAMAKKCQDWTIKGLKAKGVWVEGYDDLTGKEVEERFGELLRQSSDPVYGR
ncbi:hypothetical protein H2198_001295 [Neophaeococcomyces mojaviensis]|uniref:Uncharacterized protein n=1 Tax=Neophaeococcomyces mojaviensis TaxID=3383035 RepID=A0ACC3AI27_9EURO|nr:hypothetical protein H2198_001295 [Knufia sp. JES_112]